MRFFLQSRRAEILAEMGLTPIWRLRSEGEASGTQDVEKILANPVGLDEDAIALMDWPELKQVVAACTACNLCKTRTSTVFGIGDEKAQWLFVGDGPGVDEDSLGEPFAGQAGKLLDNMLAALGLKRDINVYIINVLKCRLPENRSATHDEAARCKPFLNRQVTLIQPQVIVVLGQMATQSLLGHEVSMASARGQVHQYLGIPLVVTYHPTDLLRNLPDKAGAWEDLCLARSILLKGVE